MPHNPSMSKILYIKMTSAHNDIEALKDNKLQYFLNPRSQIMPSMLLTSLYTSKV